MIPKYYHSNMPSAPAKFQDSNPKNFLRMIKACLIDGFTGNPPIGGWTMIYDEIETTGKMVIRSGPGSRQCYYRFDTTISTYFCEIRGYGDMTDINTGTDEFGPLRSYYYGNDHNWILIGTDKIVYIINDDNVGNMRFGCAFGDYKCNNPDFPYNSIIWGSDYSSPTTNTSYWIIWQGSSHCLPYQRRSINHYDRNKELLLATSYNMGAARSYYPDMYSNGFSLADIFLEESLGTYQVFNCGYLPGIKVGNTGFPFQNPNGDPFNIVSATDGVIAKDYLIINNNATTSIKAFDLTSDWDN